MSVRLPLVTPLETVDVDADSACSSSDDDGEEETWDDWIDDSTPRPSRSLFDDTEFMSVDEALAYDKRLHGLDLADMCMKLSLDIHGRIRLINFIRKHKVPSKEVLSLTGKESFFSSDDYLIPVIEDDPLLQWQPDSETWSESEDEPAEATPEAKIKSLEAKLLAAQQQLQRYQILADTVLSEPASEPSTSKSSKSNRRGNDSYYFDSYALNDIHATMIQDKVRTSSYAAFILNHPELFRDAVVLDVGCGTGILSLFAARAGAKQVIAIDASDIAKRAEKIVEANGMSDVIRVIQAKVEDVVLDVPHVDIIISEWMGYALLYESMLDSVLVARDKFLKRDEDAPGLMAPSQCQMLLALCDATDVRKKRVDFWSDVYGFDLSIMAEGVYDDALVTVVSPDSLLSEPCVVKDLLLNKITSRQLSFASSFTLTSTASKRTKLTSFVLYFDTFFTSTGEPISPSTKVKVIKEDSPVVADIWPVGGRPAPQRRRSLGKGLDDVVSFSTGPQSTPTHWEQTIFLLKEPVTIEEGSIVSGTFYLKKNEENPRCLDIEIHYCGQTNIDIRLKHRIHLQPAFLCHSEEFDEKINACASDADKRFWREMRNHTCSSTRKIPMEVLSSIFSWLPPLLRPSLAFQLYSPMETRTKPGYFPQWLAITYVCRQWRFGALYEPSLWCDLTQVTSGRLEQFLTLAKRKPLVLHYYHQPTHAIQEQSSFENVLLKMFGRLEELHITNCSSELLHRLPGDVPCLSTLFLQSKPYPFQLLPYSIPKGFLAGGVPNLRSVTVISGVLPPRFDWLKNVRSLTLHGRWGVEWYTAPSVAYASGGILSVIMGSLKMLEELDVELDCQPPEHIEYAGDELMHLSHLRSINLDLRLAYPEVVYIFSNFNMPSITSFRIQWPSDEEVTDAMDFVRRLFAKNADIHLTKLTWGNDGSTDYVSLSAPGHEHSLLLENLPTRQSLIPFARVESIQELEIRKPEHLKTLLDSPSTQLVYPYLTEMHLKAIVDLVNILGEEGITYEDIKSLDEVVFVDWIT
ncbi:hypothetical protein ONZ45_g3701 [Pleurotus djamor]|nr:hypothetical protein ONZ45_g3701 [Pleurotus djamor]